MAQPKKKYPVRTTPKGVLIWPHLNIADTKFASAANPDGEYRTTLRLSDEDFEKVRPLLTEMADTAIDVATDKDGNTLQGLNRKKAEAKGVTYPFKKAVDKDGNELPGWDLTFKVTKGGVDKKTGERYDNRPKQFDASFPPKPINVELRSGTQGKISYTIFQWATAGLGYGASLRPKAVQVIRLSDRGDADASYYGFDGDEEGYEHEDGGASDFIERPAQTGQQYAGSSQIDDDEIPF